MVYSKAILGILHENKTRFFLVYDPVLLPKFMEMLIPLSAFVLESVVF